LEQNVSNLCKSSCHEVASEFCANVLTRSTPLDPKLLFCCVLYHLGAFGPVKLPYKTQGKMFRSSAKVHATKSSRIFFAMNAPDPPHWTLKSCFWCVSYHLDAFGTVRLPYETRDKTGRTCKSSCHEVVSQFITTNEPDPPIGP